jgi:hypothetical protein
MTVIDIYVENNTLDDIAVALLCDVDVEDGGKLVYWRVAKISARVGVPAKVSFNTNEYEIIAWQMNNDTNTPVVRKSIQPGSNIKIYKKTDGFLDISEAENGTEHCITGTNEAGTFIGIALADREGHLIAVQENVVGNREASFKPNRTLYVKSVSKSSTAADQYRFIKEQQTEKQTLEEDDKVLKVNLDEYVAQGVTISCSTENSTFSMTPTPGKSQQN